MNLNEIKHSKRKNINYQITPKFICQYIFCFVTKSSVIDQTTSYNYCPASSMNARGRFRNGQQGSIY